MSIRHLVKTGLGLRGLALMLTGLPVVGGTAFANDLTQNNYGAITPPQRPAVDGINGAVSLLGGGSDDGELYGGTAQIALPIGTATGVQGDATLLNSDGAAYLGLGGHLFWRDPSQGLVGAYAGYSHSYESGTVDVGRLALEGEGYVGQFTVRGIAGVEFADGERQIKDGVETSFEEGTKFFSMADLAYYPTSNTEVYMGHRYSSGTHALGLGGEMLLTQGQSTGVSTFVEGRMGEGGHQAAWAGVKFHFGGADKSLIRRHREDDPIAWEPDSLLGINNARKEASVAADPF